MHLIFLENEDEREPNFNKCKILFFNFSRKFILSNGKTFKTNLRRKMESNVKGSKIHHCKNIFFIFRENFIQTKKLI